jgi:hypothetical protein
VSTLRSAIELKAAFDQIQAAEKAGNLTPEEKQRLEDQAAEKGMRALFKVRDILPQPTMRHLTWFLFSRGLSWRLNPCCEKHVNVC